MVQFYRRPGVCLQIGDVAGKSRIDAVFADLKAKGLVAAKRKIVRKKADWSLDFGFDRFTHRIYCNEMHSSLEDNSLRFALLHEEHHATSKNPRNRLDLVRAVIIATIMPILLRHLDVWTALLFLTAVIFIVIVSRKVFETAIRRAETEADLSAAKALIEKFEIEQPSAVAISLFETLRARPRDRTSLTYRLKRLTSGRFHPSDEERAKAIQKFEKSFSISTQSSTDWSNPVSHG